MWSTANLCVMLRNLWTAAGPASILQTNRAGRVYSTFPMSDVTLFKLVTADCIRRSTSVVIALIQASVRDIMHGKVAAKVCYNIAKSTNPRSISWCPIDTVASPTSPGNSQTWTGISQSRELTSIILTMILMLFLIRLTER